MPANTGRTFHVCGGITCRLGSVSESVVSNKAQRSVDERPAVDQCTCASGRVYKFGGGRLKDERGGGKGNRRKAQGGGLTADVRRETAKSFSRKHASPSIPERRESLYN
jgi:hypothetical protein